MALNALGSINGICTPGGRLGRGISLIEDLLPPRPLPRPLCPFPWAPLAPFSEPGDEDPPLLPIILFILFTVSEDVDLGRLRNMSSPKLACAKLACAAAAAAAAPLAFGIHNPANRLFSLSPPPNFILLAGWAISAP